MKLSRVTIPIAVPTLILLLGCQPGAQEQQTSNANEQIQNRGEGKDSWYDALPRAAWSEFTMIEQSQPWFEVHKVQPGVFAIYEPGQFEEVISFLIVGSERALLFDTGLGIGDIHQLVSELTTLEIIVLNSHTHYDHVGGNHQFEEIYGVDCEFGRNNALGRTHDEVKEFVGEGWIWKPLPKGFSKNDYSSKPFTITKTVQDLEEIELGERTLEVVFTPGHSPDSLCLLDRENRLLFVGDTFYPASLYAHLHGSDFDTYAKSAARLADLELEVDFILPAHNEPLLESSYLTRFREAFQTMKEETAPFVLTDGNREYSFEGFSIIVGDPPPWDESSSRQSSFAVTTLL
jgi:glyoxylase-like metal-dependent hydrolase (beta-lactamase superfamily II)